MSVLDDVRAALSTSKRMEAFIGGEGDEPSKEEMVLYEEVYHDYPDRYFAGLIAEVEARDSEMRRSDMDCPSCAKLRADLYESAEEIARLRDVLRECFDRMTGITKIKIKDNTLPARIAAALRSEQ